MCGWVGKDWAFKYQGLCNRCYKKWRKAKAEERRKHKPPKPPNENVEIAAGIVVTKNVQNRMEKQARSDIPLTRKERLAECCGGIGPSISMIALLILMFSYYSKPQYAPFLVTVAIIGFVIYLVGKYVEHVEYQIRSPKIVARLEELARKRQRQIEEMREFYASAEWRLIRRQVIQEQGNICQNCGRRITNDYDLTVDHIKPRSKFPKLALDKSNLQVLCRVCNSAKGATYNELSDSTHS